MHRAQGSVDNEFAIQVDDTGILLEVRQREISTLHAFVAEFKRPASIVAPIQRLRGRHFRGRAASASILLDTYSILHDQANASSTDTSSAAGPAATVLPTATTTASTS